MVALVLTALTSVAVGGLVCWMVLRLRSGSLRELKQRLVDEVEREGRARSRADETELRAEMLRLKEVHDQEAASTRATLAEQEHGLRLREGALDRRAKDQEDRERALKSLQEHLRAQEYRLQEELARAQKQADGARQELEHIAQLTQEEARRELIAEVEEEATRRASVMAARIEASARSQAQETAARILATAAQRLASDFVQEHTVRVVELPSDEMKGRIIGREGRNVRTFEAQTGVDVLIDDTPLAVVVSSFDPIRRHVAGRALERLVADGRIHPARIEEVVEAVQKELDDEMKRAGERAVFELGIAGMNAELTCLLGRMTLSVVDGQNLWEHAMETARIAGMLAAELHCDALVARRAGVLHDIGRVVGHEVEGDHAQVGADQARRCGEADAVVTAIREHHDESPSAVEACLVQVADVVSRARPGARSEAVGAYVKRLAHLERLAESFAGVEQAFALQAGTELRVIARALDHDDAGCAQLARQIARRVTEEVLHPGDLRVSVVRQARATEVAR